MLNTEGRDPLPNMDASLGAGAALGGSGGDQQVLLRVKSANHPLGDDLEFRANHSFSVLQVKETIQRLSNHHPEVKEQRLIYSGHLLEDGQLLKDVLTVKTGSPLEPNQPVTFHLATTSKYMFSAPANATSSSKDGRLNNKGDVSTGGVSGQPQQQQQPYIFNNPLQGLPHLAAYNSNQWGLPGASGSGFYPEAETLHAAYVEQMTAYMNQWYMLQSGYSQQMPQTLEQTPPMMDPHNYYYGNVANQPPPPQAQQQAPAQAPAAPIRPQENAHVAAARVPEEDDNQRDLLDWMYTFSRVILIFSVVYFYSSFSRFVLVVLFTGLVMILQRRNGRPVVAAVRPAAPANPPPVGGEMEEEQQGEEGPAQDRDTEQRDATTSSTETPSEPTAVPQRNLSDIAWTFLTTFFTSLIPETYQNN